MRDLNKHPFHIEYNNRLSSPLKKAINSVFDHFYFFLSYNKFEFDKTVFSVGIDSNCTFQISNRFIQNLEEKKFEHVYWFTNQALLIETEKADYIGTCFYMINCLQEYGDYPRDLLGRFIFENTYQYKFNCAEKNLVLDYFQEVAMLIFGVKIPLQKSSYLLTHDIDFVNSAWKDQFKDGVKSLDFQSTFQASKKALTLQDDWQNIEEIIQLEQKQMVSSIFFWLPVKGKSKYPNVQNADYQIKDKYIQKCLKLIESSPNHRNGLHKSVNETALKEENELLSNLACLRYHYLKFDIRKDYDKISKSNLSNDFSLGFSTRIGFRNGYGLPFRPIDPYSLAYYNFTVYPLHIMDSSLFYFMDKSSMEEMVDAVQDFVKLNAQSAVIGILWHNNFYEKKSYQRLLKIIATNLDYYKIPNL